MYLVEGGFQDVGALYVLQVVVMRCREHTVHVGGVGTRVRFDWKLSLLPHVERHEAGARLVRRSAKPSPSHHLIVGFVAHLKANT